MQVEKTKTLHTVFGILADVTQRDEAGNATLAATPAVLGYFDLAASLSGRQGRSLMQAQVFRVRGMQINMTMSSDVQEMDVGFGLTGDLRWITPTSQRVRAHKEYAQRWRAQSRIAQLGLSNLEPGRGRQFIVKYETAQPSQPYGSLMEDDVSSTDIVPALIGTGSSGVGVSIFDTFNEQYPALPAAADGTDQRMYTRQASEDEDVLPWAYTSSSNIEEQLGVYSHTGGQIHSTWVALPDGMAMDWMCGLARVRLNFTTPFISPTVADVMRLSFIALVEGWRPLR